MAGSRGPKLALSKPLRLQDSVLLPSHPVCDCQRLCWPHLEWMQPGTLERSQVSKCITGA